MSPCPVSVNDIDLATAKLIVPTDVYLFYDGWLRMTRWRQTLNQVVVLLPMQFAADNNDLNEETLDGKIKSTTHATTLVVYQ